MDTGRVQGVSPGHASIHHTHAVRDRGMDHWLDGSFLEVRGSEGCNACNRAYLATLVALEYAIYSSFHACSRC